MWRFYAELFVLVLVAFIVGAGIAAVALRLLVRDKAAGGGPAVAEATETPGGAG